MPLELPFFSVSSSNRGGLMVAGYVIIEFFQVFEPSLYSSQLLFDRGKFFL
jgi:hypothetical protein